MAAFGIVEKKARVRMGAIVSVRPQQVNGELHRIIYRLRGHRHPAQKQAFFYVFSSNKVYIIGKCSHEVLLSYVNSTILYILSSVVFNGMVE